MERIFKLRNEGSGFNNIAKIISEEFNVNVTHPTAKNLYYEYAAKQKVKSETTPGEDGKANEWDKMLKIKFERIERITNGLLDAVETIKDKLSPEMYLKYAPTIIAILRESLSQLAFIRNEQEQIVVKQQNLIYSPLQIMQQINQLDKQKDKEFIIVPNKQGGTTKMEEEEVEKDEEEEDEE